MQTGYPPDWNEDDIVIHLKMKSLYNTNTKLIISKAPCFEDGTPIEPPILIRQDGYCVECGKEEDCKTPPQSFRMNN